MKRGSYFGASTLYGPQNLSAGSCSTREAETFSKENRARHKASLEKIFGKPRKRRKDGDEQLRKEIKAGKHGPAPIPEVSVRSNGKTRVIRPGTVTPVPRHPTLSVASGKSSASKLEE